jgi:hypothetical protein
MLFGVFGFLGAGRLQGEQYPLCIFLTKYSYLICSAIDLYVNMLGHDRKESHVLASFKIQISSQKKYIYVAASDQDFLT